VTADKRLDLDAAAHDAIDEEAAVRSPDRLPVGPGHVLFPLFALIAMAGIIFGPIGRQISEDMPEADTHPYFPDHFWPYPILAMAIVAVLGALALIGQPALQLGPAADPRSVVIPRPDWYLLFLFQLVKLGPALLTSILIPVGAMIGLLLWPLIDARVGPGLASRIGWRSWPAPGRNIITGTLWVAGLAVITALTLWTLLGPGACIPWFFDGPVCAG